MSALQSLVDEANTFDPDDYIQDEAFDTFKSVLAEAEELLQNADAGQADVDAKAEALTRAMAALRKIPNKDELNKMIAEMEQKDLDGYTDRSVAAFKAALSVAKTVAADANADEQAVTKAYVNLEEAANNLVKAEKPGTGNSGKGSTSANIGNAYGAAGVVSAAQGVTSQQAYVVSDTTVNFNLKRGSAYCFKMTVVNGNAMTPSFTVGNGEVCSTQFVASPGTTTITESMPSVRRARARAFTPPCRARTRSSIARLRLRNRGRDIEMREGFSQQQGPESENPQDWVLLCFICLFFACGGTAMVAFMKILALLL